VSDPELHRPEVAEVKVSVHTIEELYGVLLDRERARLSGRQDRMAIFDPSGWAGMAQLDELAKSYTGRSLDLQFLADWVEPRLRRTGEGDPQAVTLPRAAELFGGIDDVICPRCQQRHADADFGSTCANCQREAMSQYEATMGPVVACAKLAAGNPSCRLYYELELVKRVDREIQYLARIQFGHDDFTAETFYKLHDWLTFDHPGEGDAANMLRTRVIELLRAKGESVAVPVPASTAGDAGLSGAPKKRGTPQTVTNELVGEFLGRPRKDRAKIREVVSKTGLAMGSIAKSDAWKTYQARFNASERNKSTSVPAMQQSKGFSNLEGNEPDPSEEVDRRDAIEARYLDFVTEGDRSEYHAANPGRRKELLVVRHF
jgi:hypothetical protein